MSENKNNSGLDGRELPLAVILVGGGVWYKYGHSMMVWLHENMVQVVLGGSMCLAICGYVLVWRYKKKNAE